ncbi:MAG: PD-(D/E)XK nuclease family protein, partial [bacterium]
KKELYVFSRSRKSKKGEINDGYYSVERVLTRAFEHIKEENGINHMNDNDYMIEICSAGEKAEAGAIEKPGEIKGKQKLTVVSHKEHMFIERKMRYIIEKSRESQQIVEGKIIHQVFSEIESQEDVEEAVSMLIREGAITSEETDGYISKLNDIVSSEEFQIMFDKNYEILNERNILFKSEIKRPDRVMIKDNEVLIFDYKTGAHKDEYEKQVREYMDAYGDMGYDARGFIAYTTDKKLQEVKA